MDLASFHFAHEGMFLVPVEHLTDRGMDEGFARALESAIELPAGFVEAFDARFSRYMARGRDLAAHCPGTLPPRRLHVAVVTAPEATRPFYEPIVGSSAQLYLSDFDPSTSSTEMTAFLFAYAEHLGRERSPGRALIHALTNLLALDQEGRDELRRGAERLNRPDAGIFRALAKALDWVDELHHDALRPAPPRTDPKALGRVQGTALIVPRALQPSLQALAREAETVASQVARAYLTRQSGSGPTGSPARRVAAWLESERPYVLVADAAGRVLWDVESPAETGRLARAIDAIGAAPADSLCADLCVIGERTRAFLDRVVDPESLPLPGEDVEEAGGTYLHKTRRIMTYALEQPGLSPLAEAAPPFHRLLLAARTVHEWGHLAAEAAIVRVPAEREREAEEAREALVDAFAAAFAEAPPLLRHVGRRELDALGGEGRPVGQVLAELSLARTTDYLANTISALILPAAEMEAYVRVNVRTHVHDALGPFAQITRYVYEAQYLRFSRIEDPLDFLFGCTFLREDLLATRAISERRFLRLIEAVRSVLECYAIDQARFRT